MKYIVIGVVKMYQWFISPLFPATCRFEPSCSQYAVEALRKHGALRGTYMTVRRILRCHPFSKSFGYDPVK